LKETPGGLAKADTPKIVLFSMDDGLNIDKYYVALELLDEKANPNGCPITGTFFISADYTLHNRGKELNDKGIYF